MGEKEVGEEEIFEFNARPRCSSTRIHHEGAKVVMVVKGIPHLKNPLVSTPVTLNARERRLKSKKTHQETTQSSSLAISSQHSITQFRPNARLTKYPTMMHTVSSKCGTLPQSVVACAQSSLSVAVSSLISGACSFCRK